MIENYEVIGRLVLALVLGAFLGVERIHAGKTAGIRTFGLVALGSALFIVISEQVIASYPHLDIDPMRTAAQVVTGIGFLGAGMIIFQKDHVANLTTAAGIWVSAAIGMAVGFGLYLESIVTTILVIMTFTFMWNMERYLKKRFRVKKEAEDIAIEEIKK